jgi:hypothetical protein
MQILQDGKISTLQHKRAFKCNFKFGTLSQPMHNLNKDFKWKNLIFKNENGLKTQVQHGYTNDPRHNQWNYNQVNQV